MDKIGYIMIAPGYDCLEADRKWMADQGCTTVYEEDMRHEKKRPMWHELMAKVKRGDTLYLPRLSHAMRGSRELAAFLEATRVNCVRVVAFRDRLDTADQLFPAMPTRQLLDLVAAVPHDAVALRRAATQAVAKPRVRKLKTPKVMTTAERDATIINLYKSGLPISEIWKASGFKSRSSLYRILDLHGIEYNRGYSRAEKARKATGRSPDHKTPGNGDD